MSKFAIGGAIFSFLFAFACILILGLLIQNTVKKEELQQQVDFYQSASRTLDAKVLELLSTKPNCK